MATASSTAACTLKIGSDTIGLVQNMSISMSRDTIDITAVDAAKDAGKSFLAAGQYDPGEISFDLIYDGHDTQHKLLLDKWEDAATDGVQAFSFIVAADGNTDANIATFTANGYVTSFEVTAAIDDAVKASVTIKLTGTHSANPTTD